MPVYHFVFHSHGSWMPDRVEGYYKHGEGWKAPSDNSYDQYRKNMRGQAVAFTPEQQQLLLDELIRSQRFQGTKLYALATDSTHLHSVVAWTDDREATAIRTQLKSSLSRMLNMQFGKQEWFVAKAGQQHIKDDEHLSFLVHNYLPKHPLYWFYKAADQS